MRAAINLAARGRGFVEPNPMVGCVIVKNNKVVSSGYHERFGGPHAEPIALRRAGPRARGATAYVTLEPCDHVGKTPPCTHELIRAGIHRVVVAMRDPNPLVAGRGLRRLRRNGVRVDLGLLRDEAMALNAPFVTVHRLKRPYVILKWAQSIDGKIATRTGESRWITSAESRAAAHALRARVDAVLVGVNTVLVDDPDLTARLARPKRLAARIVIDPHLRTPLKAKLVRSARTTPTLIVTSRERSGMPGDVHEEPVQSRARQEAVSAGPRKPLPACRQARPHGRGSQQTAAIQTRSEWRAQNRNRPWAASRKQRALERAGCQILTVRPGRFGLRLRDLLTQLRAREMTNVLVEGGGTLLGAFVSQHLADEARIFVAPRLIGGEQAPGPLRHIGPASMASLPRVKLLDVAHHGPDLCYTVRFEN